MNKELANQIKDNKLYKDRFDEEMKKSLETLLPLKNELLGLEDSIIDEKHKLKQLNLD